MKYKCHICGIVSRLNILLSTHYNSKHKDITKAEYERIERTNRHHDAINEGVSLGRLKKSCLLDANYMCDICGCNKARIAHHLDSYKFFPDSRFNPHNLVALCKSCHIEFHKQYGYGRAKPNTRLQYLRFKYEWIKKKETLRKESPEIKHSPE